MGGFPPLVRSTRSGTGGRGGPNRPPRDTGVLQLPAIDVRTVVNQIAADWTYHENEILKIRKEMEGVRVKAERDVSEGEVRLIAETTRRLLAEFGERRVRERLEKELWKNRELKGIGSQGEGPEERQEKLKNKITASDLLREREGRKVTFVS